MGLSIFNTSVNRSSDRQHPCIQP